MTSLPVQTSAPRLVAENVTLSYGDAVICSNVNIAVPDGKFTVVVGANGSGKSTLLRALARVVRPAEGQVVLDGQAIHTLPSQEVARKLGLLPQMTLAPEGITVGELVARGRFPHRGLMRRWDAQDEAAVNEAMARTRLADFATRPVDTLSGGQRQRVWVAMVLAQRTPLLLLDEPTTFLDIAHQVELLELLDELNRCEGRTIVAVLHDLNQACRHAGHLIAMRDGQVVAEGPPATIINEALVERVFGLACIVIADPITGTPLVVPRAGKRLEAVR